MRNLINFAVLIMTIFIVSASGTDYLLNSSFNLIFIRSQILLINVTNFLMFV